VPRPPARASLRAMSSISEADALAYLNQQKGGWNRAMDLVFVKATADEVVGEVVVADQHLQPYGIVHGGVHAGIIEAACSTGAALYALPKGQSVVGLENSTSFLHAARGGTLRVTARPLTRGRRSQAWEGTVTDAAGKVLATGRVRLLCLEPDSDLAGKKPGMAP
jgi:1,4-dihydroxy-2-naphthoyl-CoA hydrolase